MATVALDFAVLAPDAHYREKDFAAGFSVQVVTKRTKWPFMIGLGGGLISFGGSSQRGPTVGYVGNDGSFHIGSTTERRSVQLRHAEVVLRLQPFWWRIRPFVDGLFGLAVLWDAAHLEHASGEKIADNDVQRDVGALYGASIGIDWSLLKRATKDAYATYDLVLTTGVRRMYTSRMERPDYDANADDVASRANYYARLAMWQPFLALSIGIDSRAETRRQIRAAQAARRD